MLNLSPIILGAIGKGTACCSSPHFALENIAHLACENVLKDGTHVPTIIAQGSRGVLVAGIEDLPGTHDERCQAMASAGFAMAQSGKIGRLEQVFFITEGWMSVPSQGKLPDSLPSQDPQPDRGFPDREPQGAKTRGRSDHLRDGA